MRVIYIWLVLRPRSFISAWPQLTWQCVCNVCYVVIVLSADWVCGQCQQWSHSYGLEPRSRVGGTNHRYRAPSFVTQVLQDYSMQTFHVLGSDQFIIFICMWLVHLFEAHAVSLRWIVFLLLYITFGYKELIAIICECNVTDIYTNIYTNISYVYLYEYFVIY